ncbi:hypothetical protein FQN60_010589 [Etheostoma spectabile]|uniref:Uncharacterized protein n=1 Tax=Etheostoma spectabile TaxID=54343 RepID=A0A5J5C7V5_9PERO|nr:hypothetical protein FQN60_010589 [Etheostoma spectabile]
MIMASNLLMHFDNARQSIEQYYQSIIKRVPLLRKIIEILTTNDYSLTLEDQYLLGNIEISVQTLFRILNKIKSVAFGSVQWLWRKFSLDLYKTTRVWTATDSLEEEEGGIPVGRKISLWTDTDSMEKEGGGILFYGIKIKPILYACYKK